MKKITSVILVFVMLLCAVVPAFAAEDDRYVITDKVKKAEYLENFNGSVNAIKTVMPSCTMTRSHTLRDPSVGSEDGEILDENAQKWIKWIIDSCFKDGAGLANTLFSTIFGDTTVPTETAFASGEKRDNRVPVKGADYVSALTAEDNFSLLVQTTGGTALRPEKEMTYTKILFPDTALENAGESSMNKVFDLTDASLNPVIVSDAGGAITPSGKDILDDVKFDAFTFRNAYVQTVTDENGKLLTYVSDIDYCFSLSLYDFIRLVSVIVKFDFMSTVTNIANVILTNAGKGTLTPSEILNTRHLYITYNVHTELSGFSWDRRAFGDINDDGGVTVDDARLVLRHAIGLQPIRSKTTLIYSDMDFSGDVDVADARLALRAAIGLDEQFTYVPEGKEISIVEVAEPDIGTDDPYPVVPPAPEDDEPGEDDTSSGMIDISEPVAEFVQAIYDVVHALEDSESFSESTIKDLINYFQNL